MCNHCDAGDELNDFLSSFDAHQLCIAASILRPGVGCNLGRRIIGGFNVLFQIDFADGVMWIARCPLPYNCSSPSASDSLMRSYAAALGYIKRHTSIPVPEVFSCRSKSEEGNDVGVSYMLMECLPGHPIELRDVDDEDDDEFGQCYAAAEKVFRQLAGFVMQLASLQFDKIGSLQEHPVCSGNFHVDEYFDSGIVFPPERGEIYEKSLSKGPFTSILDYHSTILSLNEKFAAVDKEDEDGDYLRSVQLCRLIRPKIALPQYEHGPFVLNHDDLSSSNILVDGDYNITGIIDFPGTIVPLPALCVYPRICTENWDSPFTDRDLWLRCFVDVAPVPGSPLGDQEVRRRLMESAMPRGHFDKALSYTYAYLPIESLATKLGIEV